ncbi:hypothetical protein BJY04DRAFT_224858 [Aspergillus karnatakaensis]|uniref:uncharacterized protein n=1 Tax=Aspergillus karnatakaensis TaxID=1810916 RepID=UPI003CCD07C8
MQTSRTIHDEIKPRIYSDTLDIHLSPSIKDPHMALTLRRLNLAWNLNEGQCFNARGVLRNIPLQKYTSTRINIYAPDPGNLAQLALLCRKTLKGVKLELNLVPRNGVSWEQFHNVVPSPTAQNQNQHQRQTANPHWAFDFFWIPFGLLHKDPTRMKPLSDTTAHKLSTLIESIETFFSIELRNSLKGGEAAFLRNRQDLNRALSHVEKGWAWPAEEEMRKEWPEYPFGKVPGRIRELLVCGGFVGVSEEGVPVGVYRVG